MKKKFKKGVASFYIVAFSTLILVVVTVSFAMVIVSEMARTANDDLSKSAYDAALSGAEDAKMAYISYARCLEQNAVAGSKPSGNTPVTCADIMYWMENPDCYMVGHILGKIPKNEPNSTNPNPEVLIGANVKGGSSGISVNQFYTCVTINGVNDYKATLGGDSLVHTISGAVVGESKNVRKMKISWSEVHEDEGLLNWETFDGGKVVFPKLKNKAAPNPPVIELKIVQSGCTVSGDVKDCRFSMSSFDDTTGTTKTNRATLYLVPSDTVASNGENYVNVTSNNIISKAMVVNTNKREQTNKPFLVNCDPDNAGEGFYCSVEIELPDPMGSGTVRNDDTFMISVALPYQQPETDFLVEFLCYEETCTTYKSSASSATESAEIKAQIEVDSTARANDLVRRVVTRYNTTDSNFSSMYPYYALQILGGNSKDATKDMTVTKECNEDFYIGSGFTAC